MKVKKGKLLRMAGTVSILAIAVILIVPLFRNDNSNIPTVVKAPVIQRPPNPEITELIQAYEKQIEKLLKKSGTPGAAVAIVKDSTIVYIKGFGVRDVNSTDSIDEHTVFRIASVSKCFAGFLTSILVDEGKISWNDPVVKYLPEFSLNAADQTPLLNISHVLSHSTGLPYHTYTNLVEEDLDLTTLLSKLSEVKMSNMVGREYSYQNVAFSLIEPIAQKATGFTYNELMAKKVFSPLKMNDASMDYTTLMSNNNIARPHRLARRKWTPARITKTYYNVAPAGGVNASIDDMAQWMKALLGFRPDVISEKALQSLYQPVIEARSKNRNYRKMQRYTNSFYGHGWRVLHYPNDTLVYHGGYVNGYRSEVAFDPKDKIAICILANAPGQLADKGIPMFFDLFNKRKERILLWDNAQRIPEPSI